jgi:ribonucleoside-diphosphate reductase alpha chain
MDSRRASVTATLMDEYQSFIHKSRYARYLDAEGRRETWEETVRRYIDFFRERFRINAKVQQGLDEAEQAILALEVMPSMRCLMTAGPALERDNVAGYNCAYTPIDNIRAFDEILYILMCGTGVGFSVERKYVEKLPEIAEEMYDSDTCIVVSDSKIGWAGAFRELVSLLYAGQVPRWDLSRIRPAGERLKTFGGRSSGPAPLEDLFRFTTGLFRGAAGRRLNGLEVHDLVCKIAAIVVVGGVRRSALISLSNLSDQRMRHAKDGDFWTASPQRALSNNSVCYTERPDVEIFMEEWLSLYRSRSGERGIFNRVAADRKVASLGTKRDVAHEWGTNPCSEIILRPQEFCNLTEVVVRADDSVPDLERKCRIAAFLGTLQATLTDFRYLRKVWRTNTEEERLLGVSLTGIMDHRVLGNPRQGSLPGELRLLKEAVIDENATWAVELGISKSSATTCVKPSGTVSQLVNSASGIHARYAPFYVRRVRSDIKDPLCEWMIDEGFPHEEDVTNPQNVVFSFPVAAPKGHRPFTKAVEHLELWKIYQDHWCEHKPSATIVYTKEEFMEVGAWVYNHFDEISGVSFLPADDHVYQQAPYEQITEEEFKELKKRMPMPDWSEFGEVRDNTIASQELACSGDACEIADLS